MAPSNALPAPLPDRGPTASDSPALPQGQLLRLARVVGYGLLLLSFVDFLYVLLPPDFLDPVWEYQFTGDLVKLVPVPLLALVLVFWGDATERQGLERPLLKFLSWLTLLFSLVLFLLVPLTVGNTMRIHRFNNEQISTQVNQQKTQIEATRTQLEAASPEQLRNLVPAPDQNGQLPQAPATPQDAKAQILDNLEKAKEQAATQASEARANVRRNLIKNSLKLMAEAIIGGLLFLYTWLVTAWARHTKSYIQVAAPPSDNPVLVFSRQVGRLLGRKPRRIKYRTPR